MDVPTLKRVHATIEQITRKSLQTFYGVQDCQYSLGTVQYWLVGKYNNWSSKVVGTERIAIFYKEKGGFDILFKAL